MQRCMTRLQDDDRGLKRCFPSELLVLHDEKHSNWSLNYNPLALSDNNSHLNTKLKQMH